MARARIDPEAVLCEGCGYEIRGLIQADASGACPECGRALAASMPGRRPGSVWQAQPGMLALLATWWRVLRHPWASWDDVTRADTREAVRRARRLRLLTNGAAALTAGYGLGTALIQGVYADGEFKGTLELALVLTLAWTGGLVVLFEVLCRVERTGMGLIGRQHGWRADAGVTRSVIAHAAIGWVVSAALLGLGFWLGRIFQAFVHRPRDWAIGRWWAVAGEAAPLLLPAAGFLIGLVLFEALVYVGVRRMRFVNREAGSGEPGSEARP